MNIIIVNHNAGSTKNGMEFRPYYFAREWAKAGHNVTIVAASFSHYRNCNVNCDVPMVEYIDTIRYVWLPVPEYHDNGIERYDNIKVFVQELRKYKQQLLVLNPNIVISSSVCPLDSYVVYEIAQATQARFVASIHDVWEQLPMKLDNIDDFNTEMHKAEYFRCEKADKIISALPNLKDYLVSYGLDDKKIWYMPNGVNLDDYKEFVELSTDISGKLQAMKKAGNFLIGYAGSLDEEKALYTLLEAARELQQLPIHFIVMGHGQEKYSLREQAVEYGLQNVSFFDAVPKNMVNAFLKSVDCLYAGWKRNEIYRYGMSNNKICEYMFSSKPIIHSVTVENDLVKQSGCGFSVTAEDPKAVVMAIKKMFALTDNERVAMGHKGRDYVTRQLNYRALAEWYLQICRVL